VELDPLRLRILGIQTVVFMIEDFVDDRVRGRRGETGSSDRGHEENQWLDWAGNCCCSPLPPTQGRE
jgi:hypothetical protein